MVTVDKRAGRSWHQQLRTVAPMVVMILIVAACSGAATEADGSREGPTATYTGGACDYDGPSEFEVNSTVTFTVTNESDTTDVGFSIFKFPEGTTSEEVFNEGIFNFVDRTSDLISQLRPPTVVGTEYEMDMTFRETGQHGINCFDFEGTDYVAMFTVGE